MYGADASPTAVANHDAIFPDSGSLNPFVVNTPTDGSFWALANRVYQAFPGGGLRRSTQHVAAGSRYISRDSPSCIVLTLPLADFSRSSASGVGS